MIRPISQHAKTKLVALLACLFVGGLTTAPANAQWVVTDPAMQLQVTTNQVSQIQNMVQQYEQLVTQYTSMLSTLGSLQNIGLSSINNSQLTIINDATPFLQQSCPNATDPVGAIVGALGLSAPTMTMNIPQAQNQICQKVVLLQIHKYNTVAGILNEMNGYFATLNSLNQQASAIVGAVSNAVGDRQALGNQQDQAQAQLAAKMANVQKLLDADDAAIDSLQQQQSTLGRIAIRGSNSMIGNAMQTVVFAGALSD